MFQTTNQVVRYPKLPRQCIEADMESPNRMSASRHFPPQAHSCVKEPGRLQLKFHPGMCEHVHIAIVGDKLQGHGHLRCRTVRRLCHP